MNFLLTGVNHKSAPLEVREHFAIPEAQLPGAVQRLVQYPGIQEALIVSTCNRVEFLAHTTNGTADLTGFLAEYFGPHMEEFRKYSYEYGREMPYAICFAWHRAWIPWWSANRRSWAR